MNNINIRIGGMTLTLTTTAQCAIIEDRLTDAATALRIANPNSTPAHRAAIIALLATDQPD